MMLRAGPPLAALAASSHSLSISHSLIHASKPVMHLLCSSSSDSSMCLRIAAPAPMLSAILRCLSSASGSGCLLFSMPQLQRDVCCKESTGAKTTASRTHVLSAGRAQTGDPSYACSNSYSKQWYAKGVRYKSATLAAKGAPVHVHEWSAPTVRQGLRTLKQRKTTTHVAAFTCWRTAQEANCVAHGQAKCAQQRAPRYARPTLAPVMHAAHSSLNGPARVLCILFKKAVVQFRQAVSVNMLLFLHFPISQLGGVFCMGCHAVRMFKNPFLQQVK